VRRGTLLLPAVALIGWLAAPAGAHQGHDHGGAYEGQDHGGGRGGHDHGSDARRPRKHQVVTEGDLYPMGPEGNKVFGSAKLVRYDRGTDVFVHAAGLVPDTTYEVHVHVGPCSDMGSHYRHDPEGPEGPPNEVWPSSDPGDPRAGLQSDGEGYGSAEGHATWRARSEARAVMLHESQNGFFVSCADLN
jgi:hypothetical protein